MILVSNRKPQGSQAHRANFPQPYRVKIRVRVDNVPKLSRSHSAHGLRHHRTLAGTLAAAGGDNTAAADAVPVIAVDALPVAADHTARAEDVCRRAGGVDGPDEDVGPGDGGHGVGVALWVAIQ